MNILEVAAKLIEAKRLNSQYGWLSCFDYPKQYDEMERLNSEVYEDLKKVCNEYYNNYGTKDILSYDLTYDILENAVDFIVNEGLSIDEIESIDLYNQDDYIEAFITGGYNEDQNEMFNELFYYMDSIHRRSWLTGRDGFINDNSRLYGNGEIFIHLNY